MSKEWIAVAASSDVREDKPAKAKAHGDEIAIFRVGGEYFATSNICTHAFATLSGGRLDGFLIACPMHQGRFDIRNGKCHDGPVDEDLATYDVRVAGGMIEVRPRR